MSVMFNVVVPALVRVTDWTGLVAPMATVPKARLAGDSFASALNEAICESLPALSAIGTLAGRAPVCPALKGKRRLPKGRMVLGVGVVGLSVTGAALEGVGVAASTWPQSQPSTSG